MDTNQPILDIIHINKIIVENELHKILPRTKEMQKGYNDLVKPALIKFKEKYGKSERTYIKELLENSDYKVISNLKIKTFGNWGRKINPYIWASIYIENEKNSASNSIQLYVLIDDTGMKFGFDYGDSVNENDEIVHYIARDKSNHKIIIDAIKSNDLEVIPIEAGSPFMTYGFDKNQNVIKEEKDFKKWSKDIHIIKSYRSNEIPDNIVEEISIVINSLLPLCKNHTLNVISNDKGFWLYAAGESGNNWDRQFKESYMSIDFDVPDNLKNYEKKEEIDLMVGENDLGSYNTANALWEFANEINIGDVIICKQGRKKYLGYGVVKSDYIFDDTKSEDKHIRKVEWIKRGSWPAKKELPIKTLTNITEYSEYVNRLKLLLGITSSEKIESDFNIDNVLKNVFIEKEEFQNYVEILSKKKNLILQGSAGVGKTFIAKKIAQTLQEEYNDDRIEMIQFHQSYSYEDFIQGYRPTNSNFKLKNGVFFSICERAKKDISNPYFLIIDEINRGNLSKIFGELMMLIEADKRGETNQIKLTYSSDNEKFYVPDNLFIIGTMNTADRSLTIVDYALRRRFAFIKMKPKYEEKFENFLLQKGLPKNMISGIISRITNLNNKINLDESLGEGFEIGHSYFCSYKSGDHNKWLSNVYEYEIIPLIEEYWFDDEEKVNECISIIKS